MVVVCCFIGNSSGILLGVVTRGFRYNVFLGIWKLTFRNGDRLGGAGVCVCKGCPQEGERQGISQGPD